MKNILTVEIQNIRGIGHLKINIFSIQTNAFKIYIQKILDAGIYIVRIAGNYIELRFAQVIKKPLGFMPVS